MRVEKTMAMPLVASSPSTCRGLWRRRSCRSPLESRGSTRSTDGKTTSVASMRPCPKGGPPAAGLGSTRRASPARPATIETSRLQTLPDQDGDCCSTLPFCSGCGGLMYRYPDTGFLNDQRKGQVGIRHRCRTGVPELRTPSLAELRPETANRALRRFRSARFDWWAVKDSNLGPAD